jgi:hypothetical protein
MGMAVDRMTMASIELDVHHATATERIRVDYQVDDDDLTDTWHSLADITAADHYELQVGRNGTLPDGQIRYDGVPLRRMRYRVQMERDPNDAKKRPILEAIVISFLKRMRIVKNFDFEIDCSSQDHDSTWGLGNRQRAQLLDSLIQAGTWVPFTYSDKWYMVRVAYSNGRDKSGQTLTGNRSVSALVPWEQALPGLEGSN